ncbi:MAG: hypothetical protein GF311_07305 [Candidatus Lokiarchaeota archaeon]|nr:hypothetical protein [Candidatus Lokiarchaeota archaeon]
MLKVHRKKFKTIFGLTFLLLIFFSVFSCIYFPIESTEKYEDKQEYQENKNLIHTSISEKWNNSWGTSECDMASGIILDSEGNYYIVGSSGDPYDLTIIKYDSSGNKLWSETFDGPAGGYDTGNAIALSPDENYVYIVGWVDTGNHWHTQLVKYSAANGTYQWNRTWGEDFSYTTKGYSVKVNSTGYVFVGGNNGTFSGFITCYDSSGNNIKNKSLSSLGISSVSDMVIDSADNVYITRGKSSNTVIAKYNSLLELQWNETFTPESIDFEYSNPTAMSIDIQDNIYISGYVYNNSDYYWHVMKYNSSGNHLYNKTIISAPTDDDRSAKDIIIDKQENIFLIGACDGNNFEDDKDILIVKCDNEGDYLYNWTWDSGDIDKGRSLAYDPQGSIAACGDQNSTQTDPDGEDFVIIKFSLKPQNFSLFIDNLSPGPYDEDGNITLNWSESAPFDANNYTIYNSTTYIMEINSSLEYNAEGITNTTFSIENLTDGTYYYKIQAFNDYGNSTSNCMEIVVGRTPEGFFLSENSTRPHDSDGIFWLNWTSSENAEEYAIYYDTSEISDFTTATLYEDQIIGTTAKINMTTMGNGLWYFIVVANNTFQGGYSETQAGNNANASIGISPKEFALMSYDAEEPELDEQFSLNWTVSTYAENYSLYWSLSEISDVEESDVYLLYNGTDLSYIVDNELGYEDVIYYFKVVSENQFGTNESNNFNVTKGYPGIPPENVTLFSEDVEVYEDGIFTLNWTNTIYADNYSLYWSLSEISDVEQSDVYLLYNGTELSYYLDRILEEDDKYYYFTVVSENQFGTNSSNCLNITVGYPGELPDSFSLSSNDAGSPDLDGEFTLNWSVSTHADNYTLYWSLSPITDVNNPQVKELYSGEGLTYEVKESLGFMDDVYYFKVIAENQFGTSESNSFSVTVGNPDDGNGGLPWWLQAIFTGMISAAAGLVIKISYSRYKKRKELLEEISRKLDKIDNIEQFLKQRLGYEEWQKLQAPLNEYKEQKITEKELIKTAKKELGDRFMDIFKNR